MVFGSYIEKRIYKNYLKITALNKQGDTGNHKFDEQNIDLHSR